jgi:hypothetical protein
MINVSAAGSAEEGGSEADMVTVIMIMNES